MAFPQIEGGFKRFWVQKYWSHWFYRQSYPLNYSLVVGCIDYSLENWCFKRWWAPLLHKLVNSDRTAVGCRRIFEPLDGLQLWEYQLPRDKICNYCILLRVYISIYCVYIYIYAHEIYLSNLLYPSIHLSIHLCIYSMNLFAYAVSLWVKTVSFWQFLPNNNHFRAL